LFLADESGNGDVVFAPLYLAHSPPRGVKFRFFHRLDDIDLAADGKTVNGLKILAPSQAESQRHRRAGPTMNRWCGSTARTYPRGAPKPDGLQFANAAEAHRRPFSIFESIWCEWKQGDAVFATVGDQAHERPDDPAWVGHYDKVVVTVAGRCLGARVASAGRSPDRRRRALARDAR
jgi:hypothetical protein